MTHSSNPLAFVVLTFAIASCSSSTTTAVVDAGPRDTGAMASDAATPMDSAAPPGETDSGAEAASSKPATPAVLSVEPLAGGLHVMWKLNDTGLTGVELWRKKDAGTYAKAFTLPGTATSQHDDTIMAPGMFCYQVMTIRGTEMSDMSPEKCGTP